MCGLLGLAGNGIINRDLEIFHNLAICSQIRGIDGAGFYQINTNASDHYNHELLVKEPEDYNYLHYITKVRKIMKKYDEKILNDTYCNLIIGHVRHATKGAINRENTHPFILNRLVGAHNGTLVDARYKHPTSTDSELMFQDMESTSIVEVLKNLDEKSAFAVSIYDKLTKKIYLGRNKHRSLAVGILEDRNVMYWASEPGMLRWILARFGVKAEVTMITEDTLLEFEVDKIKAGVTAIFKRHELKEKKEVVVQPITKPVVKSKKELRRERAIERAAEKNERNRIDLARQRVVEDKSLPAVDDIPPWEQYEDPLIFNAKSTDLTPNPSRAEIIAKRKNKIPHDQCCSCNRQLKLTEAYFASRNKDGDATCAECLTNEIEQAIQEQLALPSVH